MAIVVALACVLAGGLELFAITRIRRLQADNAKLDAVERRLTEVEDVASGGGVGSTRSGRRSGFSKRAMRPMGLRIRGSVQGLRPGLCMTMHHHAYFYLCPRC
jgi:hypothetical protein